jgi:hypothetical protein
MSSRSKGRFGRRRRWLFCTRPLLLVVVQILIAYPFAWGAGPGERKPTAFLEDLNGRCDYQNVLVLGVDAGETEAAELTEVCRKSFCVE